MQGLVSLLFPEHWFPVGNRTSQWRTRIWAPLESQCDHPDQLDQLSGGGKDRTSHCLSCVHMPSEGLKKTGNEPVMDRRPCWNPGLLITAVRWVCVCVCTWAGLRVTQSFFGVEAQADIASVRRRRVAAGSRPHVVAPSACHGALGP